MPKLNTNSWIEWMHEIVDKKVNTIAKGVTNGSLTNYVRISFASNNLPPFCPPLSQKSLPITHSKKTLDLFWILFFKFNCLSLLSLFSCFDWLKTNVLFMTLWEMCLCTQSLYPCIWHKQTFDANRRQTLYLSLFYDFYTKNNSIQFACELSVCLKCGFK